MALNRAISQLHRLGLRALPVVLLFTTLVGTFYTLDGVLAPELAPVGSFYEDGGFEDAYHSGDDRVFILMIDSLRYQDATNPEQMPAYVALQRSSTFGKLGTSNDAVTVSAMRAAFSGRDNFRIFGFVENLVRGDSHLPSWFTQMQARGLRTAACSDGAFRQFGAAIESRLPNRATDRGDEFARHAAQLSDAIDAFNGNHCDVLVFHLSYGDHVSHRAAVGSSDHTEAFRRIDDLIADVAERIPLEHSLFVFGDHGHDETGMHTMGMDIPTFALMRGPAFRRGHNLGSIPITDMRYFLSFAGNVPLAPDYRGGYHPEALRGIGAELAPSFLPAAAGPPDLWRLRKRTTFVPLALLVGGLASLCFAVLRSGRARLGLVGCVASMGLFATATQPYGLIVGAVVCMLAIAHELRRSKFARQEALWLVGPLVASLVFVHWGEVLARVRENVHVPSHAAIAMLAAATLALGGVGGLIFGARRGSTLALVVGGLFAYPTIYCYGTVAWMSWMWAAWLLPVFALTLRRAALERSRTTRDLVLHIGAALCLLWILQYFYTTTTLNFRFRGWRHLVPSVVPAAGAAWIWIAIVCKLVLFVRRRQALWINAVGVLLTGVLVAYQHDALPRADPRTAFVVAGLALATVFAPKRVANEKTRRDLRSVLLLGTLLLSFYHVVRLAKVDFDHWADLILAALVSSAFLVRDTSDRVRRSAWVVLALLGIIGAGWVEVTWAFNRLEWDFLYDWMTPQQAIDLAVPVSATLVLLRYFVVVWLVRVVLIRSFDSRIAEPRSAIFTALAIKILSVALVTAGIGYVLPGTNTYLEGVQQATVFAVLTLATLGGPAARVDCNKVAAGTG